MHLRNPACRGAAYWTDKSGTAHGPHEFFPHQWAEALSCPGWTEAEAGAAAVVEQVRAYASEHPAPDETRLEAHPGVLAGISRLLVPGYPGEGTGIEHEITRLFGVPLVAVPLERNHWRIVSGDGRIAEGVVRDG